MEEAPSPLSSEQQQQLRDARDRADSFLGAAKVAAFNGWTLGFFAAVSLLFGLFSPTSLVVGLGLAAVTRNEFMGRTRLLALDPEGPELLWRNQLGLMALIIAYAAWSMYRTVAFPDPEMARLTDLLGEGMDEWVRSLTLAAYGIVILVTAIFQGWNARYYFVRVQRLRDYVRITPPWILALLHADS